MRVAYTALAKFDESPAIGDQLFYNAAANCLKNGKGLVEPFDLRARERGEIRACVNPAADHPPLTVLVLAPVSLATGESPNAQRLAMTVLGTVAVLVIGLVGRAVGGDRVGWCSAAIAAISPNLWVNDALIMSETLAVLATVLALLCAYRMLRAPTLRVAVALGACSGLAALARAELVLLIPLLAVPAALLARGDRARRVRLAVAGAVAGALVLAPWLVFNVVRFDEPTFMSTNEGIALAGSNRDSVYHGPGTGLTDLECCGPPYPDGDQSEISKVYRRRALDYIRAHEKRAVIVALARVGRTWSLFRPGDMLDYNEGEARERWVTVLGLVAFYPMLVGALTGVVVLRRRRATWWPLVVPVVVVTVASAATYGQTRFRAPAEPSLTILSAVALAALVGRQPRRMEASSSR